MADGSTPVANEASDNAGKPPDPGDNIAAELQKRISEAFDIFDHESNKTVDVRYENFSPTHKHYNVGWLLEMLCIIFAERLVQLSGLCFAARLKENSMIF